MDFIQIKSGPAGEPGAEGFVGPFASEPINHGITFPLPCQDDSGKKCMELSENVEKKPELQKSRNFFEEIPVRQRTAVPSGNGSLEKVL